MPARFAHRSTRAIATLLVALGNSVACSDGITTASGSAASSAGAAATADVAIDAIPDFNGCVSAAYEDDRAPTADRVIGIATMGLSFTPKCMLVRSGQTVIWSGALSAHPLAAGNPDDPNAGSPDSPIVPTSSGDSVSFTFTSPGIFPYYCQIHAFGPGNGMAGVVAVTQ